MTILLESAIRVTLIAAIIGLVLFAMRIKTASVLHAVWASVVVLMLLLPAWVAWGPRASIPVLAPERSLAIELLPPPLPAGLVSTTPASPVSIPVRSPAREGGGYLAIYLLGVGVFLLRLAIGTIRANRLTSSSCVVPVTVGLLHPRIILPESSREWPQAQLDAVLAHEGEHIRRRDPLFQWLALLNRALFWFHPLAWWLERRLSGLAEEACDAAVLAEGHDPRDYSEYLLDLARSVERAGARIDAVGMAMPGIGLKHRIRQMLSGVPVPRISRPRMACTVAVCAAAAAILAAGTLVRAQQQSTPRPAFEVASIKRDVSGEPAMFTCVPTCHLERMTFKDLVIFAYRVHDFQVTGGPSWIDSERYDIDAKTEGPPSSNPEYVALQYRRLQTLLRDRFNLTIHRETKELPIYELTVAKKGPKLQTPNCLQREPGDFTVAPGKYCGLIGGSMAGGGLQASSTTMANLARFLSSMLSRTVVDKTGITGEFDLQLTFTPDRPTAPPPDPAGFHPADGGPDFFTALQEQLGLKLESAKGPVEVLVIDHAERPSEN
jgi:bla regulator protein blaR1